MSKLLVVDDEESICWGLRRLGEQSGLEVATASSAERALEALDDVNPDVIILDVRLPGIDGLSAIEQIRERIGQVPIIIITAHGDLHTAVDAVRNGAFEYIVKPFDLEKVQGVLARALAGRPDEPTSDVSVEPPAGLVGKSLAMQDVYKNIALAAGSDACVLLCGESGTGKELAARAIHKFSHRAKGPFVAVNVAALNPSLAESELFGHVRGAFTGAEYDRDGLLVQADGGTLFLDEVADIPLGLQIKLLRALDHGEIVPVGSNDGVRTGFRLISATHQDLLAKVREGAFRHDLYYRLCAFQIDMPPLRERREDIRPLAEHFVNLLVEGETLPRPVFSREAFAELSRRPWHGNVRELRNVVEHAVIVARRGVIEPEHLPQATDLVPADQKAGEAGIETSLSDLVSRWASAELKRAADGRAGGDLYERLLGIVEPPLLKAVLEKHHGQCANAARDLGMHRTTVRKKLDQYEISGE